MTGTLKPANILISSLSFFLVFSPAARAAGAGDYFNGNSPALSALAGELKAPNPELPVPPTPAESQDKQILIILDTQTGRTHPVIPVGGGFVYAATGEFVPAVFNGGGFILPDGRYLPVVGGRYDAAPEKGLSSPAPEQSVLTGFLTKFEGRIHVGSNLYFTHKGTSYLVEDPAGRQKFTLRSRDLFGSLNGEEYPLGGINLDPAALKENERTPFELVSKLDVSLVHYNWKLPKVSYVFAAGITGFGFVRQVTERTEKVLSVRTREGREFCYYQNMPGRVKGLLYPPAPGRAGCAAE